MGTCTKNKNVFHLDQSKSYLYKCDYQQYLIESINENFPIVTHKKIREIVETWEYNCEKGRALSDDTQILHELIKKYLKSNGLEYNSHTLAKIGSKRAIAYLDLMNAEQAA